MLSKSFHINNGFFVGTEKSYRENLSFCCKLSKKEKQTFKHKFLV